MATSSVLKNVNIKEKHLGRSLVYALENAQDKYSKPVVLSKTVKTIKADQIGEIFNEK